MKKAKSLLVLGLVICMVLACASCGTGTTTQDTTAGTTAATTAAAGDTTAAASDGTAASGTDTFTIGFSNCSQDTPFFANMTSIIEEYAAKVGDGKISVVSLNADNDVTKQNQDIQDLIQSGIDVLIINPVNEEGPSAGVEACNKAGIPVITVDKNCTVGEVTSFVGRDNENMGYEVGQALIQALGGADQAKGTVLEIQGTAGSTTMMDRRDGFERALQDAPGLKVVQSTYCDYDRSKAIPATQDLVAANDDIVAIFGHNDDMAVGAAQVCQEKGLDKVLVCGVDGLMEAVMAIKDGSYAITASNDPVLEADTAVDTAIAVMAGEKVESFVDCGTVVIDSSNVDEYVNPDLDFATMVK